MNDLSEEEIIKNTKAILEYWQKILDIEDDIERDVEMNCYCEEMPFKELQGLLDLYKKQKERIQELEENDYAWHQLLRMENEREYRSKFLKDFRKENGENVMPDYDEIYKRYDKQKRMIELMAENLTTPISDKEWVIKYYENKIK